MAGTGLMEFAAGLSAAAKLLKSLKDLAASPDAKASDTKAQVSELYDVIIASQASALEMLAKERSMLEEIEDLKTKLARVEAWGAQKARYQLCTPYSGCMVYALKKETSNGEPPHYLCANCYEQGKRSILQGREGYPRPRGEGRVMGAYVCPVCRSEAFSDYISVEAPKYFEDLQAES